MERAERAPVNQPQRRPAAKRKTPPEAFATIGDRRPEAIAQRRLAHAIEHSSRVTDQRSSSARLYGSPRLEAQRQQLSDQFGDAATTQRQAESPAPNRRGLPDGLRSGIESMSGLAMDHVVVHFNSALPAQLDALAYAQGSDIHLAPGQERHLPHEAWHVVQQAEGRVRPALQVHGVAVNDDAGLEREAETMGQRALAAAAPVQPTAQPGQATFEAGELDRPPAPAAIVSPSVQRVVTTGDPVTATGAWTLPDYRNWLSAHPVRTAVLGLAHAPASNPDVTSMARHQLGLLDADPPPAHHFATLDALRADLIVRTAEVVNDLLARGVQANDLDVVAAMYARLDGHEGEEAILHKLEWREAHHRQYQQHGVNENTASTSGLVYGPWRAGLGGIPDAGTAVNAVNVHTMPLNVAWLLACCHHRLTFRLYVPVTERALYRKADAGMVVVAGNNQRKLSALGRELMALLNTGLYTAGPAQRDDRAPQGFETTVVLHPTAAAMRATATQLTVPNDLTPAAVRDALFTAAGLPQPGDEAGVVATATAATNLHDLETTVRNRYGPLRHAPAGAYALAQLRRAEADIVRVTRETLPAMRTRVLGAPRMTLAVRFVCRYATQPGQNIYVVGDQPALGDWHTEHAVALDWQNADAWHGTVQLPDVWALQPLQYKYLLEAGGDRQWEPGNNHERRLPDMGAAVAPLFADDWGRG